MKTPAIRPEKIALISFAISTAYLLFNVFVGQFFAHSATIQCTYLSLSIAVLFSLEAFWHFKLIRSEMEEAAEQDRIRVAYGRNDLFTEHGEGVNSAAQTRNVVERYFLPSLTVISGLLIGLFTYHLRQGWKHSYVIPFEHNPLNDAAVSLVAFIFCLVTGSYMIGISRKSQFRWIRPSGHWLKLSAAINLLTAIVMLAGYLQIGQWDLMAAKIISLFLIFLGIEMIFNVLLDFYRPRITGKNKRPPFESVSLGILTEPGKIVRNLAFALDYQFGVKVSDGWIHNVKNRILLPYLCVIVGMLYLLDCVVLIDTYEKGIRERFGKPLSQTPLEPGLYFKLPMPFESIRKLPVKRIMRANIGFREESNVLDSAHAHRFTKKNPDGADRIILWNRPHYHSEMRFLVASYRQRLDKQTPPVKIKLQKDKNQTIPVNIFAAAIPIHYKINEDQLFEYAYNYGNPDKTLECIASRVIVNYFASIDFLDLIGKGRLAAKSELEKRIKRALSALEPPIGIDLQYVGLMGVHPSVEVAEFYQKVFASENQKDSRILEAKRDVAQLLSKTKSEGDRMLLTAKGYQTKQGLVSSGDAERFQHQLQAYETAPQVYKTRHFLDLIEHDTKSIKKYILANSSKEVFIIDLQQKIRPDLLEDFDFSKEKINDATGEKPYGPRK